ncbi:MAG TPA: hypothetical protein VG165_08700 [Solirubrobacteraceae bacterium]|jgi:hypothetical protein|nr:hypothetical protein [Solirubrobacteraceae bacterium]
MSRKLGVTSLAAICLALGASPAMADVGVGNTGQGNDQGANSNQSAVNGTGAGGGVTTVIGDAAPDFNQNSANAGVDVEAMGTGDGTMIAAPGDAATQLNQSGTNSSQEGQNGDAGNGLFGTTPVLDQNSLNVTVSAELMAVADGTVLIGGNAQSSSIGVNSDQSGSDYPGGSEATGPNLAQNSENILIDVIILG